MVYDFDGFVHEVQPTVQVSANFAKRALVCLDRTNYGDRFIAFEFQQAKCAELDNIQPGQHLKIGFVLEGARQAYNGRYYTTVKGISVKAADGAQAAPAAPEARVQAPAPAQAPAAPTAQAPAAGGGVQHVMGAPLQVALAEWTAWKGQDPAGFQNFAKETCPDVWQKAQAAGQKFTQVAGLADWAKVVNRIRDTRAFEAGQIQSPSMDPNDIGW